VSSNVYSHRLLATSADQGWWAGTVPYGKRMVVMTATSVNETGSAQPIGIYVGGVEVIMRTVPASSSIVIPDLRVVAYAGEPLSVYQNASVMYTAIFGYLLTDADGAADLEQLPGPL
jgi:hypothetical protein